MPVKMVSKMSDFYLGKVCERVLSLSHPYPQHPNSTKTPHYHNNLATIAANNTAVTASTNLAIIFTRYHTTHHTNNLACLYYQATQHNNTQTIQQHYNTQKNPLQLTLQPYNANNIQDHKQPI